MDRLWSPWRMEYIRAPKGDSESCIFCDKSGDDSDEENLIVYRGNSAFVLMNLYPYNNGHLMIAPYHHESRFEELPSETQVDMMKLTSIAMKVIRHKMNAQGFNFGANFGDVAGAGIKEHLHFHIVPRWLGDTNFMPVLGHTKVQVDGLKETRALLASGFESFISHGSF